jgi:predicted AlkP superfamily phosphohydrolase/phosphomutase
MTGCNPGQHGIYDFVSYTDGSYRPTLVSGASKAVPSIWRILSDAGLTVGVINMPFTYPPEPVDGFMISGMDAPGFDARSVSPPELYAELADRFPHYDMSPVPRRGSSYDLEALEAQVASLTEIATYLQATRPVDVLALVYQGSDHVAHRSWWSRRVQWGGRTADDVLLWIYQRVDADLGRLLEAMPHTEISLVLSDHGFMGVQWVLNLNGALRDAGLLAYQSGPEAAGRRAGLRARFLPALRSFVKRRLSLDAQVGLMRRFGWVRRLNWALREAELDWDRTALFASGPFGMMRLNLRGREARGWVEPGDMAQNVIRRAREALLDLRCPDTDAPLFLRIDLNEDIYLGPEAARGPDLVAIPNPATGCYLPAPIQGASAPTLTPAREARTRLGVKEEGTHSPVGLLVAAGKDIAAGQRVEAGLVDLGPSLLAHLEQPVPDYMDGKVLPEFTGGRPPRVVSAEPTPTPEPSEDVAYTEQDRKDIEERLRSLGYM